MAGRLGRSYWALSRRQFRRKKRNRGGRLVVLYEGSAPDVSRIDIPAVIEENLVHVCRGVGETSCVTDIFLYFCPSIKEERDDFDLVCRDSIIKHLAELVKRDV